MIARRVSASPVIREISALRQPARIAETAIAAETKMYGAVSPIADDRSQRSATAITAAPIPTPTSTAIGGATPAKR